MNESAYRIVATCVFIVGASISTYFRRRADRESGDERISLKAEGILHLVALRVLGLTLWLGVVAYLLNPAWMAWAQIALPSWLRYAGAFLGVVSDVLLFWVFSSLGNNVTPTVMTRKQHFLVTTGPYRRVRHPLYAVGFLSYIAFGLLAANWYLTLLAATIMGIIALRVPKEEAALIERHGETYLEYAQRTGRFLPKLG
jgi:protein-S-isoprenylcysteine O-methyltransferase Ste14